MNQIVEQLKKLPQFKRIEPRDAKAWLEHVIKRDPSRVLWLMDRLGSGFGGSETGTLVLDAMGRSGPFGSATELINEKLMRVLPSPSNRYMRKGIALEEAVVQATLRLYGGERDDQALDAFKAPTKSGPFGLSGNPDFPWNRRDGLRALVDIKVPGSGEEKLSDSDKQLNYAIQLNTYNQLNDAYGLQPFDQLLNIHLELPPTITDAFEDRLKKGGRAELPGVVDEMVQLLKYDRPGMRLHMVDHPINPNIDFNGQTRPLNDVIQEVAAINWQAVLDGNVPEFDRRADLELSEGQREELVEAERELLELQAFAKATENRITAVQDKIGELTDGLTQKGKLSQTPHQNIKRACTLDQDAALDILRRYNIDPEPLRAQRAKMLVRDYDTLAMADYMKENGIDVSPFTRPAPLETEKVIQALEDQGENPARVVRFTTTIKASRTKETAQLVEQLVERFTPAIGSTLQAHRATQNPSEEAEQERPSTASPAPALSR